MFVLMFMLQYCVLLLLFYNSSLVPNVLYLYSVQASLSKINTEVSHFDSIHKGEVSFVQLEGNLSCSTHPYQLSPLGVPTWLVVVCKREFLLRHEMHLLYLEKVICVLIQKMFNKLSNYTFHTCWYF